MGGGTYVGFVAFGAGRLNLADFAGSINCRLPNTRVSTTKSIAAEQDMRL